MHRLKFVFGEYCFYSTQFEAVELTTHVSRLTGSLEENTASAVPLLDVGLPETAWFEAELLERASRDAMRGYLLFHRGTAIAYACCTVIGDCLRFRCIGYDPGFRDLSPGIILVYAALRTAIGEGRF